MLNKVLFVAKFPVVNLYGRTPLTPVGLLQFPLDLAKKIQLWLEESPSILVEVIFYEYFHQVLNVKS